MRCTMQHQQYHRTLEYLQLGVRRSTWYPHPSLHTNMQARADPHCLDEDEDGEMVEDEEREEVVDK